MVKFEANLLQALNIPVDEGPSKEYDDLLVLKDTKLGRLLKLSHGEGMYCCMPSLWRSQIHTIVYQLLCD